MFYDGTIYRVKQASKAVQAAFLELVREQAAKLHNPLATFLGGLTGLSDSERNAALSAFIGAGRDQVYPEVYLISSQNSLQSAAFLVKHLVPDFTGEVTEENKAVFLKGIQLHHADPEREHMLDIREARRVNKRPDAE